MHVTRGHRALHTATTVILLPWPGIPFNRVTDRCAPVWKIEVFAYTHSLTHVRDRSLAITRRALALSQRLLTGTWGVGSDGVGVGWGGARKESGGGVGDGGGAGGRGVNKQGF